MAGASGSTFHSHAPMSVASPTPKPVTWNASEPKAILAAARRRPGTCRAALLDYLAFQMPLTDATFFAGIRRVPPGAMLHLQRGRAPRLTGLPRWSEAVDVPRDAEAAAEALRALSAARRLCLCDS